MTLARTVGAHQMLETAWARLPDGPKRVMKDGQTDGTTVWGCRHSSACAWCGRDGDGSRWERRLRLRHWWWQSVATVFWRVMCPAMSNVKRIAGEGDMGMNPGSLVREEWKHEEDVVEGSHSKRK